MTHYHGGPCDIIVRSHVREELHGTEGHSVSSLCQKARGHPGDWPGRHLHHPPHGSLGGARRGLAQQQWLEGAFRAAEVRPAWLRKRACVPSCEAPPRTMTHRPVCRHARIVTQHRGVPSRLSPGRDRAPDPRACWAEELQQITLCFTSLHHRAT